MFQLRTIRFLFMQFMVSNDAFFKRHYTLGPLQMYRALYLTAMHAFDMLTSSILTTSLLLPWQVNANGLF